jgi:phenylalanyl-tRNA synthetase beta chain
MIEDELASRYCGVTISGITVKPSLLVEDRLKPGYYPKNNVVELCYMI